MTRSSIIKITAALFVLAVVLIFLGVNYVPRISALTSGSQAESNAATVTNLGLEDVSVGATVNSKYAGSDWVERNTSVFYTGSDWIERHPGGK